MSNLAYGYPRGDRVDDGPAELAEVTFQASAEFLRRVATHLLASAAAIEAGPVDHLHLRDSWPGWADDMPDVVVMPLE